ncbi:hypothetical protein ACFY41_29340 [Streptomyces syringium]|uniref:hypothetical protein n=1 Tax=Streptomyces syringium TaxID=76729 RepID=UPI0036AEACAB
MTADRPLRTYAPPARRHAYVRAMRQIATQRQPGVPVRVYFSTPPELRARPNWDRRLHDLREALPSGVEILHYDTALGPDADYDTAWPQLAATVDGLVVAGLHPKSHKPRIHELGPVGRQELITVVPTGRPVLLHSIEHGLVPVVDCQPKRSGQEPHQRLRLTIPRDWAPDSPTLQAALDALRPAVTETPQDERPDVSPHLSHPFAAPPR